MGKNLTFWLLWIMLSRTKVYKYLFEFLLTTFWGMYLRMELLAHKVVLCLIFWRIIILFSKETTIFYIPTNMQGFQFLHIIFNTTFFQVFFCLFVCFWSKPSQRVWDDISLWFWFAFPWYLIMLSIFSCVYWNTCISFWRNAFSSPLPIFKLGCLLLLLILGILKFNECLPCKNLLKAVGNTRMNETVAPVQPTTVVHVVWGNAGEQLIQDRECWIILHSQGKGEQAGSK